VIESAKLAKKKNLLCASGFCYRYEPAKQQTVKRIHDGQIGDVLAVHVSYNTGELWHRGRKPEWSEMEYQIRNWYYFTWLSGDFNVEQHCHSLDKASWVLGDQYPVAATGLVGRQVRTDPKFGNIYDHFAVVYEYANGVKVFSNCRQFPRCAGDVNDHAIGTKGSAQLMAHTVTAGGTTWEYDGPMPSMYVEEHKVFIASVRSGRPINDMAAAAKSTLMGILGRQAAYTGRRITWKQMLESKEDLFPKSLAWGPNPVPPVAMPGQTKFV
jgi:predicted dehydrogenase